MEKVKNFLLSVNFFVFIFVLIGLRITICGASIGDALAIGAVAGIQGFKLWLDSRVVEPLNETVAKELADIKATMSGLAIKNGFSKPQINNTEIPRFF